MRLLLEHKAQATEPKVSPFCSTGSCSVTALQYAPLTACRPQVLHAAALGGVASVVTLLLEAGADPAVQDGAGETALSLAVLVEQWECAEVLVRSPGGAGALQVAAQCALAPCDARLPCLRTESIRLPTHSPPLSFLSFPPFFASCLFLPPSKAFLILALGLVSSFFPHLSNDTPDSQPCDQQSNFHLLSYPILHVPGR